MTGKLVTVLGRGVGLIFKGSPISCPKVQELEESADIDRTH